MIAATDFIISSNNYQNYKNRKLKLEALYINLPIVTFS